MIIHSHHTLRKERIERKKAKGRKFWLKLLVISLTINILILSGGIMGGFFAVKKAMKKRNFQVSIQKSTDKIKRQLSGVVLRAQSLFVSSVPTLEIDMKFKYYKKILAKRDEAVRLDLLLTDASDFVPATIKYEGKIIPVELRLKGDNADHLKGDKWSFRIVAKKGYTIRGMRVFSIQRPEERNYAYEWAYLYNLRKEGILAPHYEFIRVIINGKDKGIYALEENFSKELIESQQMREGVILKFNEESYWRQLNNWIYNRYAPNKPRIPHYPEFLILQPRSWLNVDVDTFDANRLAKDKNLSLERDTALGLLESFRTGQKSASDVFDVEKLARFLAIAHLWGGEHGLSWNNIRFYYNPVTSKIEPIGFDSMSGPWEDMGGVAEQIASAGFSSEFPWGDWEWISLALKDRALAESYMKEALRITDPQYLANVRNYMDKELDVQLKILWHEYPEVIDWSRIEYNRQLFVNVLNPNETIRAYAYPEIIYDSNTGADYLKVSLENLLTLPVKIQGFNIDNNFINIKDAKLDLSPDGNSIVGDYVLDGATPFMSQEYTIYVPVSKGFVVDGKIGTKTNVEVVNIILGANNTYSTKAILIPKPQFVETVPPQPNIEETLQRHSFLSYDKETNALIIQKGEWEVKGDLVVPKDVVLMAQPGTTLKFEEDAILLTTSAIIFEGSNDYPVRLTSQSGGWGGLVVLNVKSKSILNNVIIENHKGIERGGWILTGGITFYNTSATFNKVTIQNNHCEDAMNLIHVKYDMSNSLFRNTSSDALDNDFCQGTVKDTIFMDIKGDALDVSGTTLRVENMRAYRLGDKGLSVGEKSDVYAQNVIVDQADFGAASKDLSKLEIDNMQIANTKFGLAAYQKKPEYGPAQINANNVYFKQVEKEVLCQVGSFIIANGKEYAAEEVDIDKLYEKWKGAK